MDNRWISNVNIDDARRGKTTRQKIGDSVNPNFAQVLNTGNTTITWWGRGALQYAVRIALMADGMGRPGRVQLRATQCRFSHPVGLAFQVIIEITHLQRGMDALTLLLGMGKLMRQ
jgi:hypothetical protein